MLDTLVTATLVKDIATLNLTYLGICVTIILFAGGLFYVFNFRPFQKSLEKHEERFASLDKEINQRIDSMRTELIGLTTAQNSELRSTIDRASAEVDYLKTEAIEKIGEAEKIINNFIVKATEEFEQLREEHRLAELQSIWANHYMWGGQGVHANALAALIKYMKRAMSYHITYLTDLWIKRLQTVLEDLKSYHGDDAKEMQDDLANLLSKIPKHDEEKKIINTLISKVFSEP